MIEIYGIWADVMRSGVVDADGHDDPDWWIANQEKIAFAFGVLANIGLANRQPNKEDGTVVWQPSRRMKHIHRDSRFYYGYRYLRDKHLQAAVLRRTTVRE